MKILHVYSIPHTQNIINTVGSKPSTTSAILTIAVSPSVVRWTSAFMELFKIFKKIERKQRTLEKQATEYLAALPENLADRRREYIAIFLDITEAESISRVKTDDYRKFRDTLSEMYNFDLYVRDGLTAVRCMASHWRARGVPAISARELKAAAY